MPQRIDSGRCYPYNKTQVRLTPESKTGKTEHTAGPLFPMGGPRRYVMENGGKMTKQRTTPTAKRNHGFTLMEMLIVVAIIAVLVAVAIPTFSSQLHKARVATDWANVRSYYAQLQYEFMETGEINKDYLKEIRLLRKYSWVHFHSSGRPDNQSENWDALGRSEEDHNQGYNIIYACTSGHDECKLILPME